MENVSLSWSDFKNTVDSKSLIISYISRNGNYYLSTTSGNSNLSCIISSDSDKSDFENSYMSKSTSIL